MYIRNDFSDVYEYCPDELCVSWVLDGQCWRNFDLMTQFCPAVCCNPGVTPTPITPPKTPPTAFPGIET